MTAVPIHAFTTALPVYDGRKHILGASILAAVDAGVRSMAPDLAAVDFVVSIAKFTRKTGNNGVVTIATGEPISDGLTEVAAEVRGTLADLSLFAYFCPRPDLPPCDYLNSNNDLSDIVAVAGYGGTCHLRATGVEPVLRALVDANKLIHLRGADMPTGPIASELLYIENLVLGPAMGQLDTKVVLRNISARMAFGRLVTLAELAFIDVKGASRTARISMSFQSA